MHALFIAGLVAVTLGAAGALAGVGPVHDVDAAMDGAEVHVDMEVMVWSDIVRRWMASCIFDSHIQILRLWS